MNFHWLSDQRQLDNIHVYWDRGPNNKADYYTKHHAPKHHRTVRPDYILKGYNLSLYSQFKDIIKTLMCKGILEHSSSIIRSLFHTSTSRDYT